MTPRLHELFDGWLQRAPERTLLHLRGADGAPCEMSFAQVAAQVEALEAELRADGVRPGDRVLAVAENCPEHLALILACSRLGAWSCGVNARMAPGEIAGIAVKADARVCYYTSAVSGPAVAHAQRAGVGPSVLPGLERTAPRREAVAETGPLAKRRRQGSRGHFLRFRRTGATRFSL